MTKTARAADAMKICLGVLREVEINDNVDRLNVDTASQQVRANEIPADSIAEIVEHPVAVLLKHAGMRIEARITKLGDFLGEEFYTVRRVAEDDRLVYLQFVEEGVQAVDFLLLFNESVILGYASER